MVAMLIRNVTIHYRDKKNEDVFLGDVSDIQNLDNEKWAVKCNNGKTIILPITSIEGIHNKEIKLKVVKFNE